MLKTVARQAIFGLFLVAVASCSPGKGTKPSSHALLVSAAASLKEAMQEIGSSFSATHPDQTVRFNFGASGALVQQIKQGAPVDVFASAGAKEMDELDKAKLISSGSRKVFAANRLVLIAPFGSALKDWPDLKGPDVKRIALPNPELVPSGRYGKETLVHRQLWDAIKDKCIFGHDVRQTLTYVVSGDVDAGIVFVTDAKTASKKVMIVSEAISGTDHSPITYPAAALATSANIAAAKEFVDYLVTPEAQAILQRHGFSEP